MTKAILNQQELVKINISQLLVQLTNIYQNTRGERQEISIQFPPEDEEFSLLEELELLTVNIRGYASQIQSTGKIVNQDQAIEQLQAMQVLNIPQIAGFYFGSTDNYEQIKSYIRTLDYLRLLVLEYLQFQSD
ncbi:MAG: hypothetical protein HWQ35_24295 [Nostoc sp. NMS1]|uniref:hypothetical protein n=1 Tax=unclassified Nostoc TaxID=2593658 RepID=UPI0025D72E46|nr:MULTISPECIES: hypothetical protein [unclassified Nostoc]MBN3909541.1 hypothetical protein [Nostoc sp. NMS1]MBN3990908.1 hypothetical protein [Nostoc sp. NMS2]